MKCRPKIDETPSAPAKLERSSGSDRRLEAKTGKNPTRITLVVPFEPGRMLTDPTKLGQFRIGLVIPCLVVWEIELQPKVAFFSCTTVRKAILKLNNRRLREVSLRQMDELSPHHPSGTVSFCQKFTPVQWSSFSQFLETGEALDDYAKFRSSLMGTYASLTMSIASDNKALMGWHCGDEIERLKSYTIAANVRSSMKHDDKLDELLDEFQLFNAATDPVGNNVFEYSLHLKGLHFLHQLYAYRKALAKLDFIKCDSDFDEVFQRLKSEKQWTDISDGTLRHALAQHFSLLRKLNDDLGMIGLASASKMPEGDKLLEAIENEYSQEVSDSIKDFKEIFVASEFKMYMSSLLHFTLPPQLIEEICTAVRLCSCQMIGSSMFCILLYSFIEYFIYARLLQECHFTSPKLSPLIDRALVHKSRALENFLELKGRWGRSIGGLRSKLWPVAFVFAGIPAAYILVVLECRRAEDKEVNGWD
ncbi:hypothetical protein RHSIM_Rhsim06G0217600 [Rhododendron simsii]|uniref:Uncharacterized protein n=1 Tax=Rhododendron simsii TaxID=118357 RepID=A0A834H538_RHOSS|nr:hypothetical protein RHSIM_Rhsim06G0217600 [Rhododendron simsii]